jgi:hypothetical protein
MDTCKPVDVCPMLHDTLTAKAELLDEMELVMAQIMFDLPSNKDWLDPTLEAEANYILSKAKELK